MHRRNRPPCTTYILLATCYFLPFYLLPSALCNGDEPLHSTLRLAVSTSYHPPEACCLPFGFLPSTLLYRLPPSLHCTVLPCARLLYPGTRARRPTMHHALPALAGLGLRLEHDDLQCTSLCPQELGSARDSSTCFHVILAWDEPPSVHASHSDSVLECRERRPWMVVCGRHPPSHTARPVRFRDRQQRGTFGPSLVSFLRNGD